MLGPVAAAAGCMWEAKGAKEHANDLAAADTAAAAAGCLLPGMEPDTGVKCGHGIDN